MPDFGDTDFFQCICKWQNFSLPVKFSVVQCVSYLWDPNWRIDEGFGKLKNILQKQLQKLSLLQVNILLAW